MLALGIRYLNGFAAASEPDAHERAEWPPHPGRVFMALAAAHFETGADPAERAALEWLESLEEAPMIHAGEHFERGVVTQYVPVNDKPGPSRTLMQGLALTRDRQRRTFARAVLDHDVVYLEWPTAVPPEPVRVALERLCAKVTRIGHSTSLVQAWILDEDEIGDAAWVPDEQRAELYLRVPGPGTLLELERRYQQTAVEAYGQLRARIEGSTDSTGKREARRRSKAEFAGKPPTRLRPQLSIYRGYTRKKPQAGSPGAVGSVFSPHPIVLKLEREATTRRELDLPCVLAVVQRWREAILEHSDGLPDRVRTLLSGHAADGSPTDQPHLAFLPFAFVGHEHADGRLLGLGLALPAATSREERRLALHAIGSVRHLLLGRLGRWRLVPEQRTSPPWNLRPEAWTSHPHGATHWSTVTPIAFDRHPKPEHDASYHREVAGMIATNCTRIGLPEPREVVVTHVSAHLGVPPAFAFPRLRRKDGSQRRHTHAILVFDRPVCGPILLGAGRYRGYGLARPIEM